EALIAVVSEVQTVTSAVSLQAEANTDLGTSWTIDSRCSSYVTQHAEWFKPKTAASGGINVGGKSQIPIEAVGMYDLLSVAAGVNDHFDFKRTMCIVQTNQLFSIKPMTSVTSKLYQFTVLPVQKEEAHVATTGKQNELMLLHKRLGQCITGDL
ncbi:hypothetical protein L917_18890, partial [Phytophthora nicotianae]